MPPDTLTGVVDTVYTQIQGSVLAQDATAGDGSVFVDDTSDFNETDGGTVYINGSQYPYLTAEASTGEITFDGVTLGANASAGDSVAVWNVRTGKRATTLYAQVALPGTQAGDDFITATVAPGAGLVLDEGMREAGQGESVRMVQHSDDSFEITGLTDDSRPQLATTKDRLTVFFAVPDVTTWLSGGSPSPWDFVEEQVGASITAESNGDITFREAGVYAVTGVLYTSGLGSATAATSVRLVLTFASTGPLGTFQIGCGVRGGDDPTFSTPESCGFTYQRNALDTLGAAIFFNNVDTANVGSVAIQVSVQRLA